MKKVQKIFNLFGYKSVNFERALNIDKKNEFSYESILFKRYAPWADDQKFLETYEVVKSSTLVDIYRLYELYSLAKQTANVEGYVIEVGAWRGGSSVVIGKAFSNLEVYPDIYCCDTFTGVAHATEMDKEYLGGEHADTSLEHVKKLFSDNNLDNIKILQGIFPDETGAMLPEGKIRFCHIDVDVYKSAKLILEYVWPRLSVSGTVVFDDYGFISCNGVTTLVNGLNLENSKLIYNLNGHAILIKTA